MSDPTPETATPPSSPSPSSKSPSGTGYKDAETFYTPICVLTVVFGLVIILGPLIVRKGENRGIIRSCIMLAAFCMWLFWVTIYIAQMNPLMEVRMRNTTLAWIAYTWGEPAKRG